MTMTGKNKPYKYHLGHPVSFIERLPFPYCYRCPFGINLDCDECSERVLEYIAYKLETHYAYDEIAALIIELVQGEGGFIVAPKKFIKELYQLTKENGILFISDEVQTGFGRTAKMFAYELCSPGRTWRNFWRKPCSSNSRNRSDRYHKGKPR